MKPAGWLLPALLLLAPVTGCAGSRHDFGAVVLAVQQEYPAHIQQVPLMRLVSLCAQVVTVDGVKGMRIARFDSFRRPPDPRRLDQLVSHALGSGWLGFVTTRDRNGDTTLIFTQPDGNSMRMLIADYEHGELNLVRMEVNGRRMGRWLQNPQAQAHRHPGVSGAPAIPD